MIKRYYFAKVYVEYPDGREAVRSMIFSHRSWFPQTRKRLDYVRESTAKTYEVSEESIHITGFNRC
jgi:hypothetical protein